MAEFVTKRRSPRRRMSRVVGFLHHGEYLVTETLEIGEGGLLIVAPKAVEMNSRVVLTFSIEGQELVSTRAEICYETDMADGDQKAYGVQFENLDLDYKRKIRRYVSQKTQAEAKADRARIEQRAQTYAFSVDDQGKAKPTVM